MIWGWIIPGWLRRFMAWLAVWLVAVAGIFYAGKRDAAQKAKLKAARDEAKAHERISDADTGIGASDAERIKRLRELADDWRD